MGEEESEMKNCTVVASVVFMSTELEWTLYLKFDFHDFSGLAESVNVGHLMYKYMHILYSWTCLANKK